MSLSKKDVLTIYEGALDFARSHVDSKGNVNADPESVAFNMTRSEIHEALQSEKPIPGPHPDDDGDADLIHARQKSHGKSLWKQTDTLVAAAGLTAKGLVS